MLTCDFTGNLGNHMFQYALTRSVAERNGYEWGFNPTTSNDYHGGRPQMDFMNIDYGKRHTARWREFPPGIERMWDEPMITFYHVDQVNFHPFAGEVFDVKDNTKLIIPCGQDARYFYKENLIKWFQIKEENIEKYEKNLEQNNIVLDENTCVLNVRGGEYKGIPNVLLRKKYWDDAIQIMKNRNPNMKFLVITDDVPYVVNYLFQEYPVYHFSIGGDYYAINQAKNLILSNSSFAIIPSWTNVHNPYVIAPQYWARHNVSNEYWASSNISTFKFNFLDREGNLS